MIKVFCDKCKKEIDSTHVYSGQIEIPRIHSWCLPFTQNPTTFELCDSCAIKLHKFLTEEDKE